MDEFDLQQCVTMACLLDVIAPKPGNVHRGADFGDMTFLDFAASAVAIGPPIAQARSQPLGQTILKAIQATRKVTNANTNLGIVLLIAPLAAISAEEDSKAALRNLFSSLTPEDGRNVFEAIQLAQAGGLGSVDELDVNRVLEDKIEEADLMRAMELARDRDRIAELYVTQFELILDRVVPDLVAACREHGVLNGLVRTYVELLGQLPDTLIARKCGDSVAKEASHRAARVVGLTGSDEWFQTLSDLDFWLRADGNKRNPGTTADIVTAGMFIALNRRQLVWSLEGSGS